MSHFVLIASVTLPHKQQMHFCTFFVVVVVAPSPPVESGLLQKCQETDLPLQLPAGELSQLQVHALHPTVSQAEAQELKQVRCPCKKRKRKKEVPIAI